MQNVTVAARRILSQPAFVVVALILLIAAAGLNGATQFLKLNFRKLPVPPARSLTQVPQRLGPWLQVSVDEPLPHEFQQALGTDMYVFRDFVDTRLVSAEELAQFNDKSPAERKRLLFGLQVRNPAAVLNLGLTYYTGLVDTVAHIPERCYIAEGLEPTKTDDLKWAVLEDRPGSHMVRYLDFEDQTPGRISIKRNVAYFFNCNGEYMNDSIAVRKRLAYLFEQYGYYVKIELQTLNLPSNEAARVMNDFLSNLLPEAEKSLPDWEQLKSGG